jgi:hypothetical protein
MRVGRPDFLQFLHDMGARQQQVALQQNPPQGFLDLTTYTEQVAIAAQAAGIPTSSDGLHQLPILKTATAYAALQGLGTPIGVSSVQLRIDSSGTVNTVGASGAAVTNATWDKATKTLSFTRLDDGLPITYPLGLTIVPQLLNPDASLAAYGVSVLGLPTSGTYRLSADGRPVLPAVRNKWKIGLNVATARPDSKTVGGPWDAQYLVATDIDHAWEWGRVLMTSVLTSPLLNLAPDDPLVDVFKHTLNTHRQLVRRVSQPREYQFALKP